MIAGQLVTAPAECRGFDANTILNGEDARAFFKAGYRFALRYVPRIATRPGDLTTTEALGILGAGLALMVVQHVESESAWTPSAEKGTVYGEWAAHALTAIGVSPGTMCWLDLEAVSAGVPHEDVIAYCNAWHAVVAGAGFLPGLYVGWQCGLTRDELYSALRFTHYWSSYNLNADEAPAVRGCQMRQRIAAAHDLVPGVAFPFDVDVVRADALGSSPVLFAPLRWTP